MALRGHCRELLGVDSDPDTLAQARQRSIFDSVSSDPAEIFPGTDLVVLSAPVGVILKTIQDLPALHPGTPVILDLGSTKEWICQAFSSLPLRFDPIGGHPMCGKERLGLENADPGIYRGAPFALTPLERTSLRGRKLAEQLVKIIGAQPVWMDADVHDWWVASTSHLPYLLSVALTLATPEDASPLVGPGFRSTTRLAATPPSMMMDVLKSNKENILKVAQAFRGNWAQVERFLREDDFENLAEILSRASEDQQRLTGGLKKESQV